MRVDYSKKKRDFRISFITLQHCKNEPIGKEKEPRVHNLQCNEKFKKFSFHSVIPLDTHFDIGCANENLRQCHIIQTRRRRKKNDHQNQKKKIESIVRRGSEI